MMALARRFVLMNASSAKNSSYSVIKKTYAHCANVYYKYYWRIGENGARVAVEARVAGGHFMLLTEFMSLFSIFGYQYCHVTYCFCVVYGMTLVESKLS